MHLKILSQDLPHIIQIVDEVEGEHATPIILYLCPQRRAYENGFSARLLFSCMVLFFAFIEFYGIIAFFIEIDIVYLCTFQSLSPPSMKSS